MTFSEFSSGDQDLECPRSDESQLAHIHIKVEGLTVNPKGGFSVTRSALTKIVRIADNFNRLSAPLGRNVARVEIGANPTAEDSAVICFEKDSNRDLHVPDLQSQEFTNQLIDVLQKTSASIAARSQSTDATVAPAGQALDGVSNLAVEARAIVESLAARVIGKAVQDDVTILPPIDRSPLLLPPASALPSAVKKILEAAKATIQLDAVSRDGQVGYDNKKRLVSLNRIKNASAGDKVTGRFCMGARVGLQTLELIDDECYEHTATSGEKRTVDAVQLAMFYAR